MPAAPENPVILVTGATGFIGRRLLSTLRNEHLSTLTPIAVTRRADKTALEALLDYPCAHPTVYTLDLTRPHTLPLHPAIVVHLAGAMDFFPRAPAALSDNALMARHLLAACAALPHPPRVVLVSTAEVVGATAHADERAPPRPGSAYAASKLAAEAVAREYEPRLRLVVARPTGVYGPGERFFFHEFMRMVASGVAVLAPSPLSGRVVFAHVDDVVAALITLATARDARGVYNIAADEPASLREIVAVLADALRVPRPLVYLPTAVGEVLMRIIAPVANFRKRRVFVYNPKTVRESVQDRVYSNKKLRGLGFRPKYSVLAGVEQTVRYEIETGGLARGPLPAAFARGLHLVSVVVFAVSRWAFGTRDG